MKMIKTTYVIALIAIFAQQSSAVPREKRSFPWPSFFGGGGSSNVETNEEAGNEETAQGIEETLQPEYESSIQHVSLPQYGGSIQHISLPQPQHEGSFQHLSPGYHYPIWKVHKYNGIYLKPMPISLVPNPNQVDSQKPRLQLTHSQMQELLQNQLQYQQSSAGSYPSGNIIGQPNGPQFVSPNGPQFVSPNGPQFVSVNGPQSVSPNGPQFVSHNGQQFVLPNGQQFVLPNGQQFVLPNGQQFVPSNGQQFVQPNGQQFVPPNGQQFASLNVQNRPNAGSISPSVPIPPELQELADQFGIKDASKLPSIEEAMNLLGTTSRAETIQTIKELAATPDGMNLIRQFLASDEGAAASEEPQSDSNSGDLTGNAIQSQPQSLSPQQQQFFQQQHQQFIPQQNQQFIPQQNQQFIPQQNQQFIPQQQFTVNQQGLPITYPGSANQVQQEQYGVPSPYPAKQHEIYGLPNVNPAQAFNAVAVPAPYQGYYAPRSNIVESVGNEANIPHEDSNSSQEVQVPHETYGVSNEVPEDINVSDSHTDFETQVPHEEYGVPKVEHKEFKSPDQNNEESQGGQQTAPQYSSNEHEIYGLPNMQQATFHQQVPDSPKQGYYAPHQENNVPNENSNSDHKAQVPHEIYGVPNEVTTSQAISEEENILDLSKPQQVYSIPNQALENNEVAGNPPLAEQNQDTSLSHQTYGVPNQEPQSPITNSDQFNENLGPDISVPNQELSIPSAVRTDIYKNDERISRPHGLYSLPHQQFFSLSPNIFRQSAQPQSLDNASPSQYDPSTQYNGRNSRTQIPIIRQIDNDLDRAHTNLELAERLTTTVRPEAGFFERIGSWTKYFAPPAPATPIVPPKVEELINVRVNSDNHIAEANSLPIPELPELDEPHLDGLPISPQLPNIHIPLKFIMPPSFNQGQNVHIHQLPTIDSLPTNGQFTGLTEYKVPHQKNPQPFDGQSVEKFVPDISQLPLEHTRFSNDPQFLTSYGTVTHPHSYFNDDSEPAASEIDEQHVAVVLPQKTVRSDTRNHNDIVDNEKLDETRKIIEPQRISSYDSYATGKLHLADENAIIRAIPTQKPVYPYRGRQKIEDSSISDAVATLTSGFRPIN